MLKRVLYFGNPAQLRVKDLQLRILRPEQDEITAPIEDIGYIILDHYGVTISHHALAELLANNVAVITTDQTHMPAGLFLPLAGNTEQGGSFRAQLEAPDTLKKQLWQQTIKAKIRNQANLLDQVGITGHPLKSMLRYVYSDDSANQEGAAAKAYWQLLFDPVRFRRHRYGEPPNNLFNYGYAILRGVVARALCGAGLLPMLGIHHRNRNNAFPLADDIMEPYRPFVDELVWRMVQDEPEIDDLTPDLKKQLLEIPSLGVTIKGQARPLYLAAAQTAASLKRCYMDEEKTLSYPVL
ncbi:MAG TPA: type II CRISPR-associated endonuclease Cas1 [bacterium]|nr:type II CRISPR-associated endonuclease Cas1 [bacterium]HPN43917.1 type II CRISPR-associated endonuclease Cas1 [bacterium]